MATVGFTMDAEDDALFATTAVALIISAVATGARCLLIGRFRLANLVLLTLIFVAFICVIMNFAGLELATNQDLFRQCVPCVTSVKNVPLRR